MGYYYLNGSKTRFTQNYQTVHYILKLKLAIDDNKKNWELMETFLLKNFHASQIKTYILFFF